jgi:PAS domain-containing protein
MYAFLTKFEPAHGIKTLKYFAKTAACRLSHYLRALLQPAPLFGLAIIAVFWVGLVFVLPDAQGTLSGFERHRAVYFTAASVLTLLELITVAAGIRRQLSLEKTNLRFTTALENMTHGLCMFDGSKRLVICNERYASPYRLPPELLKASTSHEAIIAHRVMSGLLKGEKSAGAVDKKLGNLRAEIESFLKKVAV